MGRQAQMMPVLASTTDQTVAGRGAPKGRWLGLRGTIGIRYGRVLHVGSPALDERAKVVVRTMVVAQTLLRY